METAKRIIGLGLLSIWVHRLLQPIRCAHLDHPRAQSGRHWLYGLSWLIILICGCTEQESQPITPADFGPVAIYQPQAVPKGLALVLSDDTGWTPAREALGKRLTALGYLVGGVDSRPYLKRLRRDRRPCVSLANDLDILARHVQSQQGPEARTALSHPAIWFGIGEGAAMVYAAAVQAPVGLVHAVVSLNFCPQLATPANLCAADGFEVGASAGAKGQALAPSPGLITPWFIFQERSYSRCGLASVRHFADRVEGARLVEWPPDRQPVGNSPDVEAQAVALMKWLDPRLPHQAHSAAALSGLPLIESRAAHDSSDYLAVLLSGDGGWAAFDEGVAAVLAARGMSTVGWDSLSYYWKPRTPEQAAADLARLLRHYLVDWQKQRVLLIGYSFGADALPFLINRLPPDLRSRIDGIALFGLAHKAAFEFHLAEWFGVAPTQAYPIAPELSRLHTAPILCVYGESETDSLCPTLSPPIHVVRVPGDHHFNGAYGVLVSQILNLVPDFRSEPTRRPSVVTQ